MQKKRRKKGGQKFKKVTENGKGVEKDIRNREEEVEKEKGQKKE